jgi:cell division protein FtsB
MLAPRHWAALGLAGLLVLLQCQLWLGRGSWPQVEAYHQQLAEQIHANELARQHNEQLASEVHDLQGGMTMVEEIARYELGLLRPNEVFVKVTQPSAPPR